MIDESKIKRASFLSKKIRDILEEKNLTIQNIADSLWVSHSYISQNLNWRKIPSDDFITKLLKAIPLTELEIKKIFQKADEEEYRYKYWKEINNLPLDWIDLTDFEKEELWKILFSKVVWVEPTKEDVEVMLEMIRMSNRNKK